jgi:riboflavin kinase/FMN adenylyltransferase
VHRWRGLSDVPSGWGPSVVAVGVFDGVHVGHRAVVARIVAAARDLDAQPVVVTFDPHPATVVRPDVAPLMLGSVEQRLDLLEALGVAATLVLPFDREMSTWSPEEFIRRVLVDALHARRVVVGANFRFGHRAAGDVDVLAQVGEQAGYDVDPAPLVGDAQPVSSTVVRGLLAEGAVAAAATALGRAHVLSGPVVRGDARGRELGFPTANVAVTAGMAVPADGVYAGWLVRSDGSRLPAALSVGTNPTFDGTERRDEAYVIDAPADLDLYDEVVDLEFVDRLRGMERFEGAEALVRQMHDDVSASRRLLSLTPDK